MRKSGSDPQRTREKILTRATAEFDAIGLELGDIALHQVRMQVLRAIEPAHVPLDARLPADGEAPERLRVPDVAGAAELGDGHRRIGRFPKRKLARRSEIGGGDAVITAQDRQRFDSGADRVAELARLLGRDLTRTADGKQADQDRPKRRCGARKRCGGTKGRRTHALAFAAQSEHFERPET